MCVRCVYINCGEGKEKGQAGGWKTNKVYRFVCAKQKIDLSSVFVTYKADQLSENLI